MASEVYTAYLVCTPNPITFKNEIKTQPIPIWLKFGDTKNPKNTRISGYNTYNPSFYALTIHVEVEKLENKLGKYLENNILGNNGAAYERVEVENRELDDGQTEWYRVLGATRNGVIDLFNEIHEGTFGNNKVVEELLDVQGVGVQGVYGKVINYKGVEEAKVAADFKKYL